ncbi:hypothetical protein [Arenimonas oryziterrae]|uniref:Porin n=1 Tax=Arenimonas oryziterrae DSM 21050 = YC6267 TaxID=1121015 RepID=A0A091AS12_9GAMM|nr:hypothetical protein [Arenimonas oryziterrae]KFN42953.1 hypothetical protein N789_12580 [Arenimonas oryziterrae DSM 21050 = YC6267]
MKQSLLCLCILAGLSSPVLAAPAAQDKHVEDLEARIKVLEANAEAMRQQAAEAMSALQATREEIEALKQSQQTPVASEEAPAAPSGDASAANAFNPAISIILNGSYAHHSLNPDSYNRSGFPLAGEAGPGVQGLSLGESEIAFSSNIDEKFYGQLTLAIGSEDGQDEVGVEEAYIETTSLPDGLTLRAGRFFSNIGYLNNHHAHTDNFSDRPLAYQAFLGNQYGDDGVQLKWVAPTDLFFEVGGEVMRGQNYPSGGAAHSGVGVHTLFAHAGGDVGLENSWLAGVSVLQSKTEGGEDGFTGDNRLYVADMTWRWAPQGNSKDGGITLRGEYFVDDRDGEYVDAVDPLLNQAWTGKRHGAYVEGVWRINRTWDAGYRYDRLWAQDTGPVASDFDPYRHNVMVTWRNSEFSLLRLQFSQDRPNPNDTDNAVTLQYQTALGAHGAHKF